MTATPVRVRWWRKPLTYLQNHQSQMKYAEYRQQGLPITSSLRGIGGEAIQPAGEGHGEILVGEQAPKRSCNCVPTI